MATSTRKRKNPVPSFTDNTTATTSDLPPSRPRTKPLRKVSPPLSSLGLNNLVYILVLIAILFTAFYSYRIVQYKSQVGGWWNLALGKRPPQLQDGGEKSYSPMPDKNWWGGKSHSGSGASDVEDRINALAEALGVPSKELASAIAGAVKEYVPPASLSSVAAKETGRSSEAMKVLLGKENEESASGLGLGSVVGMEEPFEA